MSLRPLSRTTTCTSSGPSSSPGRRGPLTNEKYVVTARPLALATSMGSSRPSSRNEGTIRSMPMIATRTFGIDVTSRPLPSFVTSESEPDSATAKFTPQMPTSALRKTSRRRARANAVSPAGSSASGSSRPWASVNRRETSSRDLCTAGAVMCEGGSPASWTMYSPRSVSTTRSPSDSSAWARPISSDAIDLPFAIRRAPCARTTSRTYPTASAPSAAKKTLVPFDSAASANRER
jgi:hypothetical protein